MAEDVNNRFRNRMVSTSTESPHSSNDRSVPNKKDEDKPREEIRGNERHILFHFFTLFSISFICGIFLIHLSLWLNSYIHAVMSPVRPFDSENTENGLYTEEYKNVTTIQHEPSETYYSSVYTQDETIKEVFMSPFYYTGTYFNPVRRNVTYHNHEGYHDFSNYSAIR
uniref:uncharacterized protein LOC120335447 n=1 Tax=Styela clava TaxID=7725 RepID=UPI001939E58D|nr:uncharacterized protein LOC120335447 [Styela clava]